MKKIMLIILLSLSYSCSTFEDFLDMEMPEVRGIVPVNESSNVGQRPKIYVDFTKDMDKAISENAFSLSSEYGNPRGYFRWAGERRLYFDLIEDLQNGGVYSIRISKKAEDNNGNNIKSEVESRFFVGSDFEKPFVVSTTPEDGALGTVIKGDPILIEFSEPISLVSAEEGFSITPSVTGSKTLSDDGCTLIFTPYPSLENKVNYSVSVDTGITDVSGNPLLDKVDFSFIVGDDFTPPTLDDSQTDPYDGSVGVFADSDSADTVRLEPENLNEGIEKDTRFRLVFSEEINRMEMSKDNNAITITPSVDYSLLWGNDDRTITLLLSGTGYSLDQVYELKINGSSVVDQSDNTLDRTYYFKFKINGDSSKSISVSEVRQMECSVVDDQIVVNESGATRTILDDGTVDMNPLVYMPEMQINDLTKYIAVIRVVFQNDSDSSGDVLDTLAGIGIDRIASINAFSFDYHLWMGEGDTPDIEYPRLHSIQVPAAQPNAVDLYIFIVQAYYNYKLSIKGGNEAESVYDANGNYMETDFTFHLNTGVY